MRINKTVAKAWLAFVGIALVVFFVVLAVLEPATLILWVICGFVYVTARAMYEAGL